VLKFGGDVDDRSCRERRTRFRDLHVTGLYGTSHTSLHEDHKKIHNISISVLKTV
jgi:hypothetical protein